MNQVGSYQHTEMTYALALRFPSYRKSCGKADAKGSVCMDGHHALAGKQSINFLIFCESTISRSDNEQISHSKPKANSMNRQEMLQSQDTRKTT